jgi:hypothetical protein
MKMYKYLFIALILVGCGSGLTVLAESNHLLPIKVEDKSALISVIWQVHGGVATLSIALLALITGLNKEKKYGIKKLDFLINIRVSKWRLKLPGEIILSLLILLLQYIFVAADALAGAVFLFTIGMMIILGIYNTVIKLILFEDETDREMKQYILKRLETSLEEENKQLELEKRKNG